MRLYESERGDGTYDAFRGDDPTVEDRDPSTVPLYDAVGFFFADVKRLVVHDGDDEPEEFLGQRSRNRSRMYWMPTSIIGTAEELLERFPEEAELIRAASRKFEDGCDCLVRVQIVFDDGDEDEGEEEEVGPTYLQCSAADEVLPDNHGIDGEGVNTILN